MYDGQSDLPKRPPVDPGCALGIILVFILCGAGLLWCDDISPPTPTPNLEEIGADAGDASAP